MKGMRWVVEYRETYVQYSESRSTMSGIAFLDPQLPHPFLTPNYQNHGML